MSEFSTNGYEPTDPVDRKERTERHIPREPIDPQFYIDPDSSEGTKLADEVMRARNEFNRPTDLRGLGFTVPLYTETTTEDGDLRFQNGHYLRLPNKWTMSLTRPLLVDVISEGGMRVQGDDKVPLPTTKVEVEIPVYKIAGPNGEEIAELLMLHGCMCVGIRGNPVEESCVLTIESMAESVRYDS